MAGSDKPSETGKKLIEFFIYEEIGIGIHNPFSISVPKGSIRVWDEIELDDGSRLDESSVLSLLV